MSILELLLETDEKKLQALQKSDMEVTRISEAIGEPFLVTCTCITTENLKHVSEISKDEREMELNILLECARIEGKKFSDKSLREKFKAETGIAVIEKLLRAGEISQLYKEINRLSGYTKGAVEEVKKN